MRYDSLCVTHEIIVRAAVGFACGRDNLDPRETKRAADPFIELAASLIRLRFLSPLILFIHGIWRLRRGRRRKGGLEGSECILEAVSFAAWWIAAMFHNRHVQPPVPVLPARRVPHSLRHRPDVDAIGGYAIGVRSNGTVDEIGHRRSLRQRRAATQREPASGLDLIAVGHMLSLLTVELGFQLTILYS